MISIREAKENDLQSAYYLMKELAEFLDESEKMTISLDGFLAGKDLYKCLLVETKESKEIVGCVIYYYIFDAWVGKLLYMDGLYLKEEYRGHSIGKLLMSALAVTAKQGGCESIKFTVRESNGAAINFYRGLDATIGDDRISCLIKL